MSWREERRADRVADREQDREDRRLAVDDARKDRRDRERAKERRREQRRQRRVEIRAALTARAGELPWLVIMGAPMVLAWSSMARFGTQLYGPVGVLLPLFSEAALLVFALAAARAVRDGQNAATLRLGTAAFAAVAAALNYLHGATGDGGTVARGVVMAMVSVGGVAVHQLVHARPPRPRRAWEQRQADRVARLQARRVVRLQRAAVRAAIPMLASDGTVRLVHRSGEVAETRRLLGRNRLVPAPVSQGDRLADEIGEWLSAGAPGTTRTPSGTAETPGTGGGVTVAERPAGTSRVPELAARVLAAIEAGELPAEPSRRVVQRYLRVRAETATRVVSVIRGEE